jgi:hypothetical protein
MDSRNMAEQQIAADVRRQIESTGQYNPHSDLMDLPHPNTHNKETVMPRSARTKTFAALSQRDSIEQRRARLDEAILAHLDSHGVATNVIDIAAAIGANVTAVTGRVTTMARTGQVLRREPSRDRHGRALVTFQIAHRRSARPEDTPARGLDWRPLIPARATVVPVRRGGRIAAAPYNEPAVSLIERHGTHRDEAAA